MNGHSNSDAPCAACGDLDGCHLPSMRFEQDKKERRARTAQENNTTFWLVELENEIGRARAKFPGNNHLLAALTEEVGELAKELLQHGNTADARKEAIQVACIAMRIATEGAKEFDTLTEQERKP